MAAIEDESYLAALPDQQRVVLSRINRVGLSRLRQTTADGNGVAFLGAGVSAPLYPLWDALIRELVDAASDRLSEDQARTCRRLASQRPDGVVEILRKELSPTGYREMLREVLRVRRDELTGRTWTRTQELIVRCNFKGLVTTNYDPGIVNARITVRPNVNATGFSSWTDDDALDRWRTGDIFDASELPVLFAHGHHNQPDAIVLATTEYRRAYAGKLGHVLRRLLEAGQLVWVGFSFGDQRIAAILREIQGGFGPDGAPGMAPRHVALMPWDPLGTHGSPQDPGVLRALSEDEFGCHLVLYPAPEGDHSALGLLLAQLTDARFPPAPRSTHVRRTPESIDSEEDAPAAGALVMRWAHGPEPVEQFTGRVDELARLDRWAADRQVRPDWRYGMGWRRQDRSYNSVAH